MNPQYSASEVNDSYVDRDVDRFAGIYSQIAASAAVRRGYQQRLDVLETLVPGRGKLLDFACGAGAFFELAQTRGWDAHGSELGRWAGKAAEARGLKNLHIGTLDELKFEPESFDVVHAAQVFEHLARPKSDLREIRRILKPGGLLYIDVPNYRMLSIRLGRDDFMLNEPPQHVNYFSSRTLAAMIQSEGFTVTRVTSGGGLKWENLIGRSIRSDIKDAYGLGEKTPSADPAPRRKPGLSQAFSSGLKRTLLKAVVRPLLYERLKLGMALMIFAKRT